jgi:hypothetical protein
VTVGSGGTRWVSVAPERLAGWIQRYAERHGQVSSRVEGDEVLLTAADGTVARCQVPFPPLAAGPVDAAAALVSHGLRDRRVGVLLVRLGGYAAGVFEGSTLVSSKVGSRQVHGRSSAGGWSQQRFARRREGQVSVALEAATANAERILLPERLDAVVLGGDRRAVETVLADRRLVALRPLVTGLLLDVPDPRLRVLQGTPARFRAVRIGLPEGP